MSLDYVGDTLPLQVPREALAGEPPRTECLIIPWQGDKVWEFLLYARSYVRNNPQDITSKRHYKDLLKTYACGN